MTTAPLSDPGTTYCEAHPSVETALRCGRCERLICPRCMVHTPGGVRCRDCAMLRRPPMYELSTAHYLRAIAAAAVVAVALGLLAIVMLPLLRSIPLFGFMAAILVGAGAGTAMAEAVSRATNGKRGAAMQAVALAGLVAAFALRLLIVAGVAGTLASAFRDLLGLATLAIALVAAWQRLR